MVCKITCIKHRSQGAFTLIEMMVSAALAVLAAAVIVSLLFYTCRSFVVLDNYTSMNQSGEFALDKMSIDIRQARQLTAYSTNSLSFIDANGNPLQYIYTPSAQTLVCVSSGQTNTYLDQCSFLQFSIFQHTAVSNSFNCYSPAYVSNACLVQVQWVCSSPILGVAATTENMGSATFAVRSQ